MTGAQSSERVTLDDDAYLEAMMQAFSASDDPIIVRANQALRRLLDERRAALSTPATTREGEVEHDDETCTSCWGTGYDGNREMRCDCQGPLPVADGVSEAWETLAAHIQQRRDAGQFGMAEQMSKQLDVLRAALAALPPSSGWEPIETAPRDGTRVDLWHRGYRVPDAAFYTVRKHGQRDVLAWWDRHGTEYQDDVLSHWRPLPPPPSSEV